ncbi:hypothetical protein GGS20DRAFT_581728 [Poronia punctata]|nr:hypothetical protein GGS20DRAFT_581728 [Poronia punctata]
MPSNTTDNNIYHITFHHKLCPNPPNPLNPQPQHKDKDTQCVYTIPAVSFTPPPPSSPSPSPPLSQSPTPTLLPPLISRPRLLAPAPEDKEEEGEGEGTSQLRPQIHSFLTTHARQAFEAQHLHHSKKEKRKSKREEDVRIIIDSARIIWDENLTSSQGNSTITPGISSSSSSLNPQSSAVTPSNLHLITSRRTAMNAHDVIHVDFRDLGPQIQARETFSSRLRRQAKAVLR